MTSFDFTGAPESRAVQFIVGWTRAAFAEIAAIVQLSTNGLDYTAGPNRRTFVELVLRLQWIFSVQDREPALDAMIEEEQRLAKNHQAHVLDMGLTEAPDFSDLDAVVTQATADKSIRQQAKSFTDAAKGTPSSAGLFRAWREETQYAHATAQFAVAYAPASAGTIGKGRPYVTDPEFETLLLTAFGVMAFTARLLLEEGTPREIADAMFDAFFDGVRAGL